MNINELNRVRAINIEEKLENTERGTGTFAEILDKVMSGVIVPLVDNSGRIVAISVDSKVENLVEDCIEKEKFEMRYSSKPVMDWVIKSLKIKADGKVVVNVIENQEEGIKVITDTGEVIDIETPYRRSEPRHEEEELPGELDIPMSEIEANSVSGDIAKAVKKYLRRKYNHYLSGIDRDIRIEVNDTEEIYHVTNIHWGRKI